LSKELVGLGHFHQSEHAGNFAKKCFQMAYLGGTIGGTMPGIFSIIPARSNLAGRNRIIYIDISTAVTGTKLPCQQTAANWNAQVSNALLPSPWGTKKEAHCPGQTWST
jgi:hypothetical protein